MSSISEWLLLPAGCALVFLGALVLAARSAGGWRTYRMHLLEDPPHGSGTDRFWIGAVLGCAALAVLINPIDRSEVPMMAVLIAVGVAAITLRFFRQAARARRDQRGDEDQ